MLLCIWKSVSIVNWNSLLIEYLCTFISFNTSIYFLDRHKLKFLDINQANEFVKNYELLLCNFFYWFKGEDQLYRAIFVICILDLQVSPMEKLFVFFFVVRLFVNLSCRDVNFVVFINHRGKIIWNYYAIYEYWITHKYHINRYVS